MAAAQFVYRNLLRPILFRLDPETAHRATLAFLAALPALRRGGGGPGPLQTRLWHIDFANPIGLAAGLDKDGRALRAWQTMGFGFAEIGTITPRPQTGNERPRMWRLPEHRALINRLGFPSLGMDAVAPRLETFRRNPGRIKIGLNFGPNRITPVERVADDYVRLITRLGAHADFIVINVSSPNTPGLREWQAPQALARLLDRIIDARRMLAEQPALLIKLAPDLEAEMIAQICATAAERGAEGFVAGNTTLARAEFGLVDAPPGGLSGQPLMVRARALIETVYHATGGRLPIIGVGGISTAQDAWGHLRAGASLVEIYTGLIYEGPALVGVIKHDLMHLMQEGGWRSISEVTGSGVT
ncbi:MAG TPA: quinone-dependent dihydroorotate dehydrogenase [Candidatus Binataceae bacterium]|nr:quinone-dependent dihydroorotate dehydrogenase [Candidatus Binataceae bacterium]